jgi:hypothetical protein
MKLYKTLFILFVVLSVCGCNEVEQPEKVTGLRPIYGNVQELATIIKSLEPQTIKHIGKIYTKDHLLFINDMGIGVHVFDNTDDKNPIKLKFISIPGNVDIAIKGQYMYADLGSGIATIDISNLDQIQFISFNNDYLEGDLQVQPPRSMLNTVGGSRLYYECPDKNKGEILAWVAEKMPKPQCYLN